MITQFVVLVIQQLLPVILLVIRIVKNVILQENVQPVLKENIWIMGHVNLVTIKFAGLVKLPIIIVLLLVNLSVLSVIFLETVYLVRMDFI